MIRFVWLAVLAGIATLGLVNNSPQMSLYAQSLSSTASLSGTISEQPSPYPAQLREFRGSSQQTLEDTSHLPSFRQERTP
jgi:hypothetical protein